MGIVAATALVTVKQLLRGKFYLLVGIGQPLFFMIVAAALAEGAGSVSTSAVAGCAVMGMRSLILFGPGRGSATLVYRPHGVVSSAMPRRPRAVTAVELVRTFQPRKKPAVHALDRVSLSVDEGEVHGLLGPNGAGKTTFIKILTTVLLPTSGHATICGHDVVRSAKAVRPLIGIVFGGERGLYTRLTARQNLEYWASLYRLTGSQIRPRVAALLERVGLADKADLRVETYSRGMKQRLHLARGLVAGAKALFLDEPTAGMDPIAAREFRSLITEIRAEGTTILLATHDMVEAEVLCDRVTLIDRGRILATESPRSLGRLVSRFARIDIDGAGREVLDRVATMPGVESVTATGEGHRIHVDGDEHVPVVLKAIVEAGVVDVRTSRPSLEEVYVGLIGDRGMEV